MIAEVRETNDALPIDDEGGRHALGLPLPRYLLPVVPPQRELGSIVHTEVPDSGVLVVLRNADNLEAAGLVFDVEVLELRERLLAGLAPRRPEVDDEHLSLHALDRDLSLPVHRVDGEIGR